MATITKRGDAYRIRVSCGYKSDGQQVIRSMTYKPDPGMSEKQIDKEVNRQAVLFEESCKQGQTLTAGKFEAFAREWFKDYAEIKLKRQTLVSYHRMEKRVYPALGHIRIDRITVNDIQRFIRSLVSDNLCPDTVKCHVRFVSVILNSAVKKQIIKYNPCTLADLPTSRETEHDFYSVEEVRQLLELLRKEDEDKKPFAAFFTLAAYMGARKGELLGLEWKDVDFANSIIFINRAYYYDGLEHETYTDTPKTAKSKRGLKLPGNVMEMLSELREWQNRQREICGGSWVESDRLFIEWNGEPIHPSAPNNYFISFCKRAKMRKVKIHSFRHFNASVLINSGVDVVTVQSALGHSRAATTLNIYSHAFNTVQTRAMEAISNAINLE